MSTRRRGGGSKVLTRRPNSRQRAKRMCEDGAECKFQHEYQHQLEFTHDKATSTRTSRQSAGGSTGGGGGGRGGGQGTRAWRGLGARARDEAGNIGNTTSTLKGTGPRGRKVAVAADRRRAERSLRQGVEDGPVEMYGGDEREAQRARWVMRMQREVERQPTRQELGVAAPRRGRMGNASHARTTDETSGLGSSRSSSVDEVEDELGAMPTRVSSSSSIFPSPSCRRGHVPRGAGRSNIAGGASSSVGCKRVAAGSYDRQGESRTRTDSKRRREQIEGVEIICIE